MINNFQIFHSFSEKLVGGWGLTGKLHTLLFDKYEIQHQAIHFH